MNLRNYIRGADIDQAAKDFAETSGVPDTLKIDTKILEFLKQKEAYKAMAAHVVGGTNPVFPIATSGIGGGSQRIVFSGPAGAAGVAGFPLESCQSSVYIDPTVPVHDPLRLLMGRLRKTDIPASVIQYIVVAAMPTKTFVSIYKEDGMTTLEDDTAMFPSDSLVTRMRLLLG